MADEKALTVQEESIGLGVIQVSGPADVIRRATMIADELANIVKTKKLYNTISGRQFVRVEGWATLGAMLGVLPREVSVIESENGDFEAVVELVRASDGAVIGRGSALVGADETTWAKRPRYARRSMSITRATGKAYRLGFAWIMTLAGYEATPAEEMDGVIEGETVKGTNPAPKTEAPTEGNGKQQPTLDEAEAPNGKTKTTPTMFYQRVLKEIPYYRHVNHINNALKQLGYAEGFKPALEAEMYMKLQAHANQKANEEAQ